MGKGNAGTNPTKAIITIKKSAGDETLTCFVNPTEYTMTKSNNWTKKPILGKDVPSWVFAGGEATVATMELLFDTTIEDGEKDVRKRYTNKLWDAMYTDTNKKDAVTQKSEPPRVIFSWGSTWSFEAVITNMSQKFILFQGDGTPTRSLVNLTLTQVTDSRTFAKQNPTSGSLPGRLHVVRDGDRLDLLAQEFYQKPMLWRYIAEHNDIDNPRNLVPGQRLFIPPLP
jgi:Contractile injection system tube protein/LysM domain